MNWLKAVADRRGVKLDAGLDDPAIVVSKPLKSWEVFDGNVALADPEKPGHVQTSATYRDTFTDPAAYSVRPVTVSIAPGGKGPAVDFVELADKRLTKEEGDDGSHYTNGIAYRGPNGEKDVPARWRGRARNYGLAHELMTQSPVYQRGIFDIYFALTGAVRSFEPADVAAEKEEAAQAQAWALEDAFNSLEGGFDQFLAEAVYSLTVPGFGIWLRVYWPDGRLRKLSFRRPNTLHAVILDKAEQEILAFSFLTSTATEYQIDARDCLVLSFFALGNDIEGLSPWRGGCEYERGKQMILEIAFASLEAHGDPETYFTNSGIQEIGEKDEKTITEARDNKRAGVSGSLILPPGIGVDKLGATGTFPGFMEFVRYCDEMQVLPLSSEGSLYTGTSGAGSYAALDVKDRQRLGVAEALGRLITKGINGDSMKAYHGITRALVDDSGGPLEVSRYPALTISLFQDEDASIADIIAAKGQGLIQVSRGVLEAMHARLGLPMPDEAPAAAPMVAPVALGRVEASASCRHDHGDEDADELAMMLAEQLDLFRRPFDVDDGQRSIDAANLRVGGALEAVAKRHRADWVAASEGASYVELMGIRDTMRTAWLPEYRAAALPHVAELTAKGGMSLAFELGLISKVPARILDAPVSSVALGIADQVALKSYNIVESYLLQAATLEANGLPEAKRPPMPTATAFVKQAAALTAPAFAVTRNDAIEELLGAAKRLAPAGKKPKIIAEYSSVMEADTCDPCAALDGRRWFVGSADYEKYKPPSVCLGGSRCRCIMSYLANEADFADIYKELEAGFSKAGNTAFSDSPGIGSTWTLAAIAWSKTNDD